jgi:hypothetical protein
MKITLISLDVLGINNEIYKALKRLGYDDVKHINFYSFIYKYPSIYHRLKNFFLKTFFNYDIKKEHLSKEILNILSKDEKQDKILMLNSNFLLPHIIKKIKPHTNELIAFFNDNVERIPKIKKVAPYFDKVYSFEPYDCEKYGYNFLTNYIFKENDSKENKIEYEVFNISSYSKRINILYRIALKLDEINVSHNFIIFGKKKNSNKNKINFTTSYIDMENVNDLVSKCNILLDIHREGQNGLSFRVFESIGNKKKLITTNNDIKNYDFYNPNNILIIDSKNIILPKSFFEKKYEPIPNAIYRKYLIENWTKTILKLKND